MSKRVVVCTLAVALTVVLLAWRSHRPTPELEHQDASATRTVPASHMKRCPNATWIASSEACPPPPPPAADTRTPAQLALAACSVAGGGWACPAVKRPMMSGGGPAGSPPSWTVPEWYVDGTNVTACASDANSGTSATCGAAGVGPLSTHWQIRQRLGTDTPLVPQDVTVTDLSDSQSGDVFSLLAAPGSAGAMHLACTPSALASGTIAAYTPLVRSPAAFGTIEATGAGVGSTYWSTACNGGSCVGNLVHDTSAGSWFWVIADLGSATASISTPMGPANPLVPPYVAPVAGHAFQVVHNPNVAFPRLFSPSRSSTFVPLTVTTCTQTATYVYAGQAFLDRIKIPSGVWVGSSDPTWLLNSEADSGVALDVFANWWGGLYRGGLEIDGGLSWKSDIDGDAVFLGQLVFNGWTQVGRGYINSIASEELSNFRLAFITSQYGGGPQVWGPAALDLSYASMVVIQGTAASGILLSGALTIDGQSTAFPWLPGSNAYGTATTVTPAAIDVNGGLGNPATGSRFLFR